MYLPFNKISGQNKALPCLPDFFARKTKMPPHSRPADARTDAGRIPAFPCYHHCFARTSRCGPLCVFVSKHPRRITGACRRSLLLYKTGSVRSSGRYSHSRRIRKTRLSSNRLLSVSFRIAEHCSTERALGRVLLVPIIAFDFGEISLY